MKQSNSIVKFLLISLAALLIAYFTFFGNSGGKHYQWTENYRVSSDQPYGTMFVQKLLASYRPGKKFTLNEKTPLSQLLDTSQIKEKTDYVFIGNSVYMEGDEKEAILNFVYSGNNVFLASTDIPTNLLTRAFERECDRMIYTTHKDTIVVTMNFYNDRLKKNDGYRYLYRFGKIELPYYWDALSPEIFCDSTKSITPMGYFDSTNVNFFKMSYGKGALYVHTNPIAFTNYFMTQPDKVEYASNVFSHLNGEAIIWDEYSKSPYANSNAPKVNPMAYILQQDSLRYAWWLMLLAVILYAVFTARRKQRVMAVIEPKTNTSLEFINLISNLHFQNGNHRDIGRKKMKYFFYFIKMKYGLHTQHLSEIHQLRLSEKSKVAAEDVKAVAIEFDRVDNHKYYDESMLIDLQIALEKFYKHSK